MANEQINTIYHYTDWKAFEDIVGNKRMQLSNVKLSNDSNEIIEFLNEYNCRPIIELAFKIQKKLKLNHDLSRTDLMNIFVNRVSLFSFCFTKKNDDAAQWERYANKGLGVCIGFNEDYIKKFELPFRYDEIKYNLTLDENKTKKSIKEFNDYLTSIENKNTNSKIFQNMESRIWKIFYELYLKSFFYKNYSFESENEYRLCIPSIELKRNINNDFIEEGKNEGNNLNTSYIRYSVSNEKIREYICLKMDKFCNHYNVDYRDFIKEIIIGPKSIMNEELVKRFLEYKKLPELTSKVKKSKSSLR